MGVIQSPFIPLVANQVLGFVDTPIIRQQIDSGSMSPLEITPIGRPTCVEENSDALLHLVS